MMVQIALTQVLIFNIISQQPFLLILVLRYATDCQTKLEKLTGMLISGAAKVNADYGNDPATDDDVRRMLFGVY